MTSVAPCCSDTRLNPRNTKVYHTTPQHASVFASFRIADWPFPVRGRNPNGQHSAQERKKIRICPVGGGEALEKHWRTRSVIDM